MSSRDGKMENCSASFVFIATSRMVSAMEILITSSKSSSHVGIGRIIISTMPIIPRRTVKSFAFNASYLPLDLGLPFSLYT
ncbi:hypothetical protein D3C72_2287680 [compost metagenome]